MLRFVFLFAMIVCASPAVSGPLVLNCRVVDLAGMPNEWRQIDRVEVDEERSTIAFAVARTLGSDAEISFTFGKKRDAFGYDQIAFERVDATIRIVALRLGSPVAIWVERLSVRLVALNAVAVEHVELACG